MPVLIKIIINIIIVIINTCILFSICKIKIIHSSRQDVFFVCFFFSQNEIEIRVATRGQEGAICTLRLLMTLSTPVLLSQRNSVCILTFKLLGPKGHK